MVKIATRIRPGIYWDEENRVRRCVVLETHRGHAWIRLEALDMESRERILDPPAAIPVSQVDE